MEKVIAGTVKDLLEMNLTDDQMDACKKELTVSFEYGGKIVY